MKKTLITIMFLCLGGLVMAQEANETEFKMSLGDTLVWKPFTGCKDLGFSIRGAKIVNLKPMGEQVEIIANRVGHGYLVATCQGGATETIADITVVDPNDVPVVIEKPVKPATQEFTGTYKFNPPTNNYFVTINDMGSKVNETYMKHGNDEAHNDGLGLDRFWNIKTGKNWYYCPESQGWTDDVDWEFEPFGESFYPLNSFEIEVENKSNLSNYYVGTEKVLSINCWHFFVDFEDGTVIQYWVDPANGCTLKRQMNSMPAKVVTVYDLKYTKLYFGPSFKKGLHDTRR